MALFLLSVRGLKTTQKSEGMIMSNLGAFKRSYFLGRALWIRGPHCSVRLRAIYSLLRSCGVSRSGIVQMNPNQFSEVFSAGFSREVLSHYQVFVVKDFEGLTTEGWLRFARAMDLYRYLRFDLGIRLLLLVNEQEAKEAEEMIKIKESVERLITDVSDLVLEPPVWNGDRRIWVEEWADGSERGPK